MANYVAPSRLTIAAWLAILLLAGCGGGSEGDAVVQSGNTKPIANTRLTLPETASSAVPIVRVGSTVTVDGAGSFDADGDRLTYNWTLISPYGSAATMSSVSLASSGFVVDVAGKYLAKLTVNDGKTSSNDTPSASVSVQAEVPVPVTVRRIGEQKRTVIQNSATPEDLRIQLIDQFGWPLAGIVVEFSATTGYFSLNPVKAVSDWMGNAVATPAAPSAGRAIGYFHIAGPQTVVASVAGFPKVTFDVDVTPSSHPYDGQYACGGSTFFGLSGGQVLSDAGRYGSVDESNGNVSLSIGGVYRAGYYGVISLTDPDQAKIVGYYTAPTAPGQVKIPIGDWNCERQ